MWSYLKPCSENDPALSPFNVRVSDHEHPNPMRAMPKKCPVKRGNYKGSYPHCSQNTTPYTLTPKPTAPQTPQNPNATPQQPASFPISLPSSPGPGKTVIGPSEPATTSSRQKHHAHARGAPPAPPPPAPTPPTHLPRPPPRRGLEGWQAGAPQWRNRKTALTPPPAVPWAAVPRTRGRRPNRGTSSPMQGGGRPWRAIDAPNEAP